ncbi:MAG TPA: hypothetical protein VGC97_01065 [Pyrinomonadaceae bacterium]|jgi:hypothetical protein
MKSKITNAMLSAIITLLIMGANAYSQSRVFSAPQNMGATTLPSIATEYGISYKARPDVSAISNSA